MNLSKHKKEIVSHLYRIYKRGLTTSLGGNISKRISGHSFIITPSGIDKCNVHKNQITEVHFNGRMLSSAGKPSMETSMHLKIYQERSDINAIVHAHPPLSSTFCVIHKEINTKLTGEAWALLGEPANVEYALMGSDRLAKLVADAVKNNNILLLKNHGVVCLGRDLPEATERVEALENAAKMTLITFILNDKIELSKEQLKEIEMLFS